MYCYLRGIFNIPRSDVKRSIGETGSNIVQKLPKINFLQMGIQHRTFQHKRRLLMNFMTDWAAMVAGILELFYSDVNMSPLFLEV